MSPRPSGTGRRLRSGLALGLLLLVVCGLVATPVSSGATVAPITVEDSPNAEDTAIRVDDTDGSSGLTIDRALESDADAETVEVIVRLSEADPSPGATPVQAAEAFKRHAERTQSEVVSYARSTDGVAIRNRFWVTNAVLLEVDTSRVDLESFGRFEDISTLHTNFEVELDGAAAAGASAGSTGDATATTASTESVSTDGADATDGLAGINAPAVWSEYGANGSGATVAVLDTGVDVSHPDIDLYTADPSHPTYPGGWAEFDRNGNRVAESTPRDFGDHGTHVSGTVAGGDASGTHIGVAPGVDLLHGAVLTNCDDTCSGSYSQVIEGMQWAIERDADVVSMSLGVQAYEEKFVDPVRNAQSSGTIVVSSAGNNGDGTSGSPANIYETFAVGAATDSGEITDFSSGETVVTDDAWDSPPADWPAEYTVPDVAAPGSWVESAEPGGGYQFKSGTSMAAPHVTGSIALLRSVNPALRPDEIMAALEKTAWKPSGADPGQDTRYGYGIVDVKAAADATSLTTVSGTVTDRAGEPIADATVAVDGGRWTATTDEHGAYELRVVPGDRTVVVDAPGHKSDTATLELPAGETVTYDVTLDFVDRPADEALPDPIEANGTVTTAFDVEALESLTVTPTENATLEETGLEFSVDGRSFGPNETIAFDSAVTDDQFAVTTQLPADLNGTLELDYEFARGNETQTIRAGPVRVVPEIYDVGVVAGPDDPAAARLRTELADSLPIAYRTSHVNTTDAVSAAESGAYDVFVALELPAPTTDGDGNPTAAFVDATAANRTGVLSLGNGSSDDALGRLARDTSAVGGLETASHDGPLEVVIDETHPLFAGVGTEREAVTLRENATTRTWFDAKGAQTLASSTDDGVLADGTAVSIDRSANRIVLGATPRSGPLTDDGRSIVTSAVEYLGAGRFHVTEDFDAYGVSGGAAETATVGVPETGSVAIEFAEGTTVDPANVTLAVNGTEIAPGEEVSVDDATVKRGLAVDVSVADGIDGETVRLAATFESDRVTTSAIRFEGEPPARYAGTVAVNGKPARDGLAVRATYDGTVVAETTTADGRFGVPIGDGGSGVLEVNAADVPENATLTISLENAALDASPTWTAGEESRTDLAVSYDDPFDAATVTAPRWTAAGDEIGIAVAFDGGAAQYVTDRAWLEGYETEPRNRWNATHTYGSEDEGVVSAGMELTDLAGETRTVSTRVLVIDGSPATVNGTISLPASGSGTDGTAESGVGGSVFVTPAHGNWIDERPVENGAFEAATEGNVSTHGVFLETSGAYPLYRTILDRAVSDGETVAVELAAGHELEVAVTDENGVGVPNATVSVMPIDAGETDDAVVTRETTTDESGLWTGPNGDGSGASVDGPVTITVTPPDGAGLVDETVVRTLTVDEDTTATFEFAERSRESGDGGSSGGSGGGGNGGGGSGGAPIGGQPGGVRDGNETAGDAMNITATTVSDGRALLEVDGSGAGRSATTALDGVGADGVSFRRVGVVSATDRASYAFALRAGNLGAAAPRDGAFASADFDHDAGDAIDSLTLEFAVAEAALPDGAMPEDVVVSQYRNGEWQSVETSYDAGTETHAATVSGLPAIAISADPQENRHRSASVEPALEVVDSSIEPTETRAGDPIRIDATIENVGDGAGTETVTVAADGAVLATERVDLAPGDRRTISFEATLESSATITVDGSAIGDVTVTDGSGADGSAVDEPNSQSDTVPGFGVGAAIAAIATGLVARAWSRP
ncbi:S8 family serine peptidase [Natrinema versiforme]|uniref:Uncharacterized protein n=1 Tax=Natrinema versiforme TaxID=88724 RepID=A0A4P8WL02_9EURY|nr:S8 family serine peptidase [Natrinema versiforme]QCS42591.1 hypothetical protein FEJ81_09550 [Natrinema versiforme]